MCRRLGRVRTEGKGPQVTRARAFLGRALLRLALTGRVRWSIVLPIRNCIGGGL
jgi:hypothetical protein